MIKDDLPMISSVNKIFQLYLMKIKLLFYKQSDNYKSSNSFELHIFNDFPCSFVHERLRDQD